MTSPDESMLDKAIDLLVGAVMLQDAQNDHAALLLATHSGINSADAISEFHGDPFSGDHRSAPEHLRRLDSARLSDAARWLRQLIDMKTTVAYEATHRERVEDNTNSGFRGLGQDRTGSTCTGRLQ